MQLTHGTILATWPSWSRDGRWLYFNSGGKIYKMPDGGGEPVETTVRGIVTAESPDGRTLYFTRRRAGDISLWSIPVVGGKETKLLDPIRFGFAIGRRGIYFERKPDSEGRSEVCLYAFSSGKIRTIATPERPRVRGIAVSPDERTILFSQQDESSTDLMLVENFQ